MALRGTRVAIQVYDPRDEERLGFLYSEASRVDEGKLGFVVGRGDRPPRRIRHVSYRPACVPWQRMTRVTSAYFD